MRYDCLIVSKDGRSLWLEPAPDGQGWSLPSVECEQGWLADAVGAIGAGVRERTGLDVAVLRELHRAGEVTACELEALEGGRPPAAAAGRWHDAGAPGVEALPADQREAMSRWRDESGGGGGAGLPAWQRRGWFEEASGWMVANLQRAEMQVELPVTQVKGAWTGSSVLKAATAAGPCYLKAVPAQRPGEPAVLKALAERWSRHLPDVIASDEARSWLLMRALGGPALEDDDRAGLAEAVGVMARIQIDQAPRADKWLAQGCPDRTLKALERRLERLLVDIPRQLAATNVLGAGEQERLAAFVPAARDCCRGLAEHAIPARSIHHEDFRSGNVHRAADGRLVIIDWNETVVAHPFFSLQRFLWFMATPEGHPRHEIGEGEEDAHRRAVRDAYLEPFTTFEPRDRVLEAFRLSSLLAPVYALLYFDSAFDVDAAFRRGLGPEEAGNARGLMGLVLEAATSWKSRSRRART